MVKLWRKSLLSDVVNKAEERKKREHGLCKSS